ncbi:MAG: hypothetical protein J6W42_06200 [Bacteroidaceae bacterium]|nr:hypothetical protein [Bacteroidaceae bacterium]
MKTINAIILSAAALVMLSSVPQQVYSQNNAKKPAWITKAPTVKNTYVGIASVSKRSMNPDGEATENAALAQTSSIIVSQLFFNDKYKESGRREAEKKILASLHLAVDANSLLGNLILKGAYNASFDDIFIEKVFDTPLLKFQGDWEDDEEYWCYYSISEADYKTRITELEDSICNQAETMWKLGMSYQQDGMLFTAAKTYSEALNLVHPLIYSQHNIKYDFENVDLFTSIYNSYIHVYDDINLSCSVSEIPAVAGESVPATFRIKVDQKGNPVKKVGVVIDYEGITDGTFITDDNGQATFSIVKATDEPIQTISFSLDKDGLYGLPETYAFKQLTSGADNLGTAQTNVKLFDPTNYIYLSVNPADSATDKAVNELIAARKDLVIVTDRNKADLILEAAPAIRLDQEADPKAKWPINKYLGALSVSVKESASNNELFRYGIDQFQYLAPTSRTKDQVLHSSAKEMSRQLTREFPDKFSSFKYDKRSLVWSALK